MPGNSLSIDVDISDAIEDLEAAGDAMDEGAADAVEQLTVLAEGAMKDEAPEGAGYPDVHMRSTIDSNFKRDGKKATVKPHKRTSEGWLLHRAVVGHPSTPSYSDAKPPVWTESGVAQGPLAEWADAKLGDRSAAWALREAIFQSGQATFPNKFIDRSFKRWQGQVERIADREVAQAIEDAI